MGTWGNVLISHLHLVIPMSYLCHYTNLCPHLSQTHTHTHTHTHTVYIYISVWWFKRLWGAWKCCSNMCVMLVLSVAVQFALSLCCTPVTHLSHNRLSPAFIPPTEAHHSNTAWSLNIHQDFYWLLTKLCLICFWLLTHLWNQWFSLIWMDLTSNLSTHNYVTTQHWPFCVQNLKYSNITIGYKWNIQCFFYRGHCCVSNNFFP